MGQCEPQDRWRGGSQALPNRRRLRLEWQREAPQALGSEIRGSWWFWAMGTGIQEATGSLGLSPGRWHAAEQAARKTTPSHRYQPPHSSWPPCTNSQKHPPSSVRPSTQNFHSQE